MYSLYILFFSLPLYFSHLFSPIGLIIGESYSFERYKVYFFLILLALAYIEGLIRYGHRIVDIFQRYIFSISILCIIPIASALYFATPLDVYWLMGGPEKHHGYIFYIGIILFSILLMANPREHLQRYISWSLYAAIIVSIVATGEYLGGIFDIYARSELVSLYTGRSVSTLGNPNYVAGYLLIFLPLCSRLRLPERWIIRCVLVLAILTTGSYIGMALVGAYFLYGVLRHRDMTPLWSAICVCIGVIGSIYIGHIYLDPEKLLSLMSRFVLMRETLSMMIHTPLSFLIGFGPDSIISHFSHARSLLVNSYFPGNMSIDSSHNICIDIVFQYGIVPLLLVGGYLYRHSREQKEELHIAILLGVIFLALNVFVISHIIVLILLMMAYTRTRQV